MESVRDIRIPSGSGSIVLRLRLPEGENLPAVLILHGYSGCKEEYDVLAQALVSRGYVTVQIDARGTGDSSGRRGDLRCSTEWIEDAQSALSYITALPQVDPCRIGVTGCSMGGANTMYLAAMDPRVSRTAAMNPLGDGFCFLKENFDQFRGAGAFEAYKKELEARLRDDVAGIRADKADQLVADALGMTASDAQDYVMHRRANPQMISHVTSASVYYSFITYAPVLLASRIRIPTLIIHGTEDTLVPECHSLMYYDAMDCEKSLRQLEGAGHDIPASQQHETAFSWIAEWFDAM